MVIHNNGGLKLTQLIAEQLTKGQYGDDGTIEDTSDTGLISPIVSSEQDVIRLVSGTSIQLIHELDAGTSNGETLREFTIKSGTDSINRVTVFDSAKNDKTEITTSSIWACRFN